MFLTHTHTHTHTLLSIFLLWANAAADAAADGAEEDAIPLGVNYGTVADNLPSPAEAVKLLQSTRIRKVKLFSVEPEILQAMAGTELEVMLGIGDDQIKPLASSLASAQSFVEAHVKPFFPATKISSLSLGNEVLSSSRDGEMIYDLPIAMENLHSACELAGLPGIKITTPHSMGLLQSSVCCSWLISISRKIRRERERDAERKSFLHAFHCTDS
jgi:hypothetical protein